MADPDEKRLLALLKRDGTSAIKIIFEKYHTSLCNVAYRLLGDKDSSKDVVQDVFIKFWSNRASITITTSLAGYLKRSVINAAINQLEKEQRAKKISLDKLPDHLEGVTADGDHTVVEITGALEKAINKLPVRARAVFILIRNEEMSYKEVSETLNISSKAVEKEMMKALRLLREMLTEFLAIAIAFSWL